MVEFGAKLKKLRTEEGLTQQQLGDLLGVSKSVVSYYEVNERVPSPDTLVKISKVFHVSTDYLLSLDNGRTINIDGLSAHDEEIIRRLAATMRKLQEEMKREEEQKG
ncbi:MAG: helix-turn-helix transcriptional regulator [Lachnospiraceae bacterium]|nr:helix-turn-helix transcriptional regulator [Lachnospiraceae bacterium]